MSKLSLPFFVLRVVCPIWMALGCCLDDDPKPLDEPETPAATHSALLSIQEASVARAPQVGHGLSVRLEFTEASRPPDFDDLAGGVMGCRAWLYDVSVDPPPAASGDEGEVAIVGTQETIGAPCVHAGAPGYVCPVAQWDLADTSVTPDADRPALYTVPGARFTEELATGRYLWIQGPSRNAGRFPILAIPASDALLVHAPEASEETFTEGTATILAGAGPVPNNPRDPIQGGERVSVSLSPADGGHFDFPELTAIAGPEFQPDEATLDLLTHFPLEGGALTLSCAGPGGHCGRAEISALSITTTDADVTSLSPLALPAAVRKQVTVLCAVPSEDGSITVPSPVMELLQRAHAESPITRVRVAYMRDGFAIGRNASGAPNPVSLLVGHQVLGFTTISQ